MSTTTTNTAIDNLRKVSVPQIKGIVKASYKHRRPVLALGDPGLGKSQSFMQAAKELEIGFIDLRTTLIDPVDLRGLPDVDRENRVTRWLQPDFLPTEGAGILLLDELPAAPPMVQSALLQLVLDRKIGDYTLPDGWMVCAAGNYASNRAGSSRLNKALSSRFLQIHAVADLDAWTEWANETEIAPEVIAFLQWRPDNLHAFDPVSDTAFPCPRSWAFVSDYVKDFTDSPDRDILGFAVEGLVGPGAATELLGFLEIAQSLRAPEVYLANPAKEPLPDATSPATTYALVMALAARANRENAKAFFTLAERMPIEFGWLMVNSATQRDRSLCNSKGYTDYVVKHDEMLG